MLQKCIYAGIMYIKYSVIHLITKIPSRFETAIKYARIYVVKSLKIFTVATSEYFLDIQILV